MFEAAARLGKFSAAAEELQMTQAGVSQHVAQLEAELGLVLFERRRRGVALTAPGAVLLDAVSRGLKAFSDGLSEVRRLSAPRTIHILTDFGFAGWWLMPRISALSGLMPEVEIRLVTTQSEIGPAHGEFDLAVLFGDGAWPGCRAQLLFREEVYPVCAPACPGDRPRPIAPAQLGELPLLHLRSNAPQRWFEWSDWFQQMGVAPPPHQGLAFNNYQLVLQAALLGQGVALGWAPLIDDLVAQGSLVRIAEHPLSSPRGYHVVRPLAAASNPACDAVEAWLLKTAAASRGSAAPRASSATLASNEGITCSAPFP